MYKATDALDNPPLPAGRVQMTLRRPSFRGHRASVAIVATLALGIGGVAAFASVLVYVSHTLQWRASDRLQWVMADYPAMRLRSAPPAAAAREWQDSLASFGRLGALSSSEGIAVHASGATSVQVIRATPVALELGAERALAGQILTDMNDSLIMVSRRFAMAYLGGVSSAPGANLVVDGRAVTVVGVFSERLARFLSAGTSVDIIRTLDLRVANGRVTVVGQLRDGVSVAQAQEELRRLAPPTASARDPRPNWLLLSRGELLDSSLARLVSASLIGIAILLLVMLSNVGHLLHARSRALSKATAIRVALGATPRRLIIEAIGHSTAMAAAGAVGGGILAAWFLSSTTALLPKELASLEGIQLAPSGVVAGGIGAVIVLLVFSLALNWPRHDRVVTALKSDSCDIRQSALGRMFAKGYLVMLAAATCTLAVGTALVTTSVLRIGSISPGFDSSDLHVSELTLPDWKYQDPSKRRLVVAGVAERIAQLPGTRAVALASQPPSTTGFYIGEIAFGEQQLATPVLPVASIGAGYFGAIGQHVIAGREFGDTDVANPAVVIVSASLARRFAERPEAVIGGRLRTGKDVREIVGVVGDVRSPGITDQMGGMQMYLPLTRLQSSTTLIVRRASLREADVRAAAAAIEPDVAVRTSSVTEMLRESRSEVWFLATLLAGLTAAALLLGGLGTFGVVTAVVTRHRTSIAIRSAVGATPAAVRCWLAAQVFAPCAAGVAIGVALSFPFARLFAGQLFDVRPDDLAARVLGAAAVLVATAAATVVPAIRAGRIAPAVLMRQQ